MYRGDRMNSLTNKFTVVSLAAALLLGCGREAKQLGADCTEIGTSGSAHGLEPCLKLAAKYPDTKYNGLDIAWSGIQMHCSYDATLSSSRQKECDNACVQMRVFSSGHGTPDGIHGNTYRRTGTSTGECFGGEGSGSSVPAGRAGKPSKPGVGLTE